MIGPGTSALNGTGFALPDVVVTDQPDFNFVPTMIGQYTVQLTINDGVSIVASNAITLTAGTVGQGVVIGGLTQNTILTGSAESLTGTLLSGTGATAVSYTWTVTSNGKSSIEGTSQSFNFEPTVSGVYQVTLTVLASDGTVSTSTELIDVANPSPSISILGAPTQGQENVPITLTAGGTDPLFLVR